MKKVILHITFIILPFIGLAQNLVPNSSFENYTLHSGYNTTKFDSCLINCWVSPLDGGPQYFNLDLSGYSYPINGWVDAPDPRSGLANIWIKQVRGAWENNLDSTYDIRTYRQTKLIQPLIAGQSYTFKMYVSSGYFVQPTGSNTCGNTVPAKNLGVHLSATRPMNSTGLPDRLDVAPQISFSGIDFYTQPNGWMELTATYIATGGEEYLTIGNFDYFADTEFQNGTPVGVPPLTTPPSCNGHAINTTGIVMIDDVSLIPFGSTDTTELRLHLGADTTICGAINLTLSADNGFAEYFWSTGETTQSITVTQPGTYWCRTQEFCASCADTIVVSQANFQTINLGADTVFCTDGNAQIPLSTGGTYDSYLWSTGATTATISPTSSGLYWVEASYACGTVSDSIFITANIIPSPPIVKDTTVCLNTVLIGSAQGVNLVWYPDSLSSGQNNAPDIPTNTVGEFDIYVSQAENGCESSKASYRVSVIAPPYFEMEDSLVLCSWQDAYVGISNSNLSFLWNDSSTLSPRNILENGFYTLTANNQCGNHSESIEIVKNPCDCYFYLPNAFTPNGDAINSEYKPVYDCYFKEYEMRIFNRWGEVVFSTQDPNQGWDGSYLGSQTGSGIYGVQVVYTDRKYEHQEIYNGHVVVLR